MAFADEITVEALEADPYPIYARLRREAPVAWVPAANVWFVTRWRDVEFVSKNADLFAAEVPTSPVDRTMGSPTILTCDGPAHGELRRGFDVKYKPRAVAAYIDDLAKPIIAEHLDRIAAHGTAELISEYFEPASSLAVAQSLGFAGVDSGTLLRWFHGLAIGAANYENDPDKEAIADAAGAEIDAAILPVIARLERAPDESAVSHMLHDGMPEGQTRKRDFLLPSIKVALLGGMQEPGHGAASVLVGLLTHPDQMQAVLGDLDTLLPLWVPAFFGSAFNIFLLRQFFMQIPMELEDAAKIDGCSYPKAFWNIMLPQIKPALAATSNMTSGRRKDRIDPRASAS